MIVPQWFVDLSAYPEFMEQHGQLPCYGDDRWSLRLTAINIANKEALYNFISTFSGTHYVTPRALTAEIGFHF